MIFALVILIFGSCFILVLIIFCSVALSLLFMIMYFGAIA